MKLSSFKIRVVAVFFDYLIISIFFSSILSHFILEGELFFSSRKTLAISLCVALLFPLYKLLAEWKFGCTLGKRIFSIAIVNKENQAKIKFSQALKRNLYLILFFIIPYLALIIFYDDLFFESQSKSSGLYEDLFENALELTALLFVFAGLIIAYLIYLSIWLLILFLSSVSVADSSQKQTLFDVFSSTISIVLEKKPLIKE